MDVQTRDTLNRIAGEVEAASVGLEGAYKEGFSIDTVAGFRSILEQNVQKIRELVGEARGEERPGPCRHPSDSHAAIDPGYFKDDGLFYGPVRCLLCDTVEELDGVERKERGGEPVRESVRGFSGVYLDACCPGCGSAFLAMDDGKLAPVVGSRSW